MKRFIRMESRAANMTSLRGVIETSYDELVRVFGPPEEGSVDEKTDAEWVLYFPEVDTIATIYNWKNGVSYNGPNGTPVECITRWHIGGHTGAAKMAVYQALERIFQDSSSGP